MKSPCEWDEVLNRAVALAQARGEPAVSTTHLLLAIMAQPASQWPLLIVERGGMSLPKALKRLHWKEDSLLRVADSETSLYRPPMRLTVVIVVVSALSVIFRARHVEATRVRTLPWDLSALEVLKLARRFADQRRDSADPPEPGAGHLLLSLAGSPGPHLRLIDGGTVISCAVRRELGLAAWHHRLVLACDWPKLKTRRLGMRLDRGVAAHGRLSRWGAAWIANGALGLVAVAVIFPITVLANVMLYVFLWPAALLMGGLRSICGFAMGYRVANHRWHEIPGGEISLGGLSERVSDRRIAALVLFPRVLAFLLSVTTLVVLVWRSQRLGVTVFPTVFTRPDLATGHAAESFWVTPLVLCSDMLSQNGLLAGIGLLAGTGLGFMSVPTYRELTLIRLYAGHEVELGSRIARLMTLPATIFTGAVACVEAILPFRNGPIYLTVYIVPMAFSLLVAGSIAALLPY